MCTTYYITFGLSLICLSLGYETSSGVLGKQRGASALFMFLGKGENPSWELSGKQLWRLNSQSVLYWEKSSKPTWEQGWESWKMTFSCMAQVIGRSLVLMTLLWCEFRSWTVALLELTAIFHRFPILTMDFISSEGLWFLLAQTSLTVWLTKI